MDNAALTIFILAPVVAAGFIFLCPKDKLNFIRGLALLGGLVSLAIAVYVYANYDPQGPRWQFQIQQDWVPALRIGYHLGVDGISLPLVLLTGILNVAAILMSFGIQHRAKEYFALLLLVEAGIAGSFVSLDLFFFLLFYELASIPIYFLIGMWGSDGRQASRNWITRRDFSAMKLILYLQVGGGLILLGFLALYFFAPMAGLPHRTFDFVELLQANFGQLATFSKIMFVVLLIAFGIEAGLFPFHTWLPDGHSAAPTAVSMLLAGVLLKMGGYGMIRFACELLPSGAAHWLHLFAYIAVINILYGAWCALRQSDIKYIIAYSSVSHMGIVFLGMASNSTVGWSGSLFQMFSHGIITALLFALAGLIYDKSHTRDVTKLGGLAPVAPFLATTFILGGLAGLGLPGMSGFVAEFLTFIGSFSALHILVFLAAFGLVLSALYILLTVKRVFFGPLNEQNAKQDYHCAWWARAAVSGLIMIMIFFGVVPGVILNIAQGSLATLVHSLNHTEIKP